MSSYVSMFERWISPWTSRPSDPSAAMRTVRPSATRKSIPTPSGSLAGRRRSIRAASEWIVPETTCPPLDPMRSAISLAAAFVNVHIVTSRTSSLTARRARSVRTRVLPDPAPARTTTHGLSQATAAAWRTFIAGRHRRPALSCRGPPSSLRPHPPPSGLSGPHRLRDGRTPR